MSRPRFEFHGAFGSKAKAAARERKVGGFTQTKTIQGRRRYVVMKERNAAPKKTKARKRPNAGARQTGKRPYRPGQDATLEAAAAKTAEFHGKDAKWVMTVDRPVKSPETLAHLGMLTKIVVSNRTHRNTMTFKTTRGLRVACTPDGNQLYIDGAIRLSDDQLDRLGVTVSPGKIHVTVGVFEQITYNTRKGFHNFEQVDYWHNFGEDEQGGEPPILHYDTLNNEFYISGGTYHVEPEGIVN